MPVSLPARMLSSTRARPQWRNSKAVIVAVLLGGEARVPVAVLVEDRELRAGVRPLAAAD